MVDRAPPPDHSVAARTTTPPPRQRADSGSSTSNESNRSVRTVTSDDLHYVHENGRTYGNHTYYLPCVYLPSNDLHEQDRLSLQHQIFVNALQGKLTTARLLPSTRRILDLGTGPGHWPISMSLQYPNAEIVGIDLTEWDLSTTEATLGESKVIWELDDLDVWGRSPTRDNLTSKLNRLDFFTELSNRNPIDVSTIPEPQAGPTGSNPQAETSVESLLSDPSSPVAQPEPGWHFSEPFEMIHLRNMKGTFGHWEEVYAEIYKSLSPGGWVECADYDLGQMPPLPEDHASTEVAFPMLRKLYAALLEASFKSGRPPGLFYMHPSYLEEAGFKDVQTTHVNVPIGPWPMDEKQKSIGKLMLVIMMETFETSLLRPLTKWGSKDHVWTVEELKSDIAIAQQEISEWSARAERGEVEGWCASFKWITGRKSWHA